MTAAAQPMSFCIAADARMPGVCAPVGAEGEACGGEHFYTECFIILNSPPTDAWV